MKILAKWPRVSNEKVFNIPVIKKKKEKETPGEKNLQNQQKPQRAAELPFYCAAHFQGVRAGAENKLAEQA